MIEAFETGVQTGELRRECVGQLIEARVLCGCRGFAQQKEQDDQSHDLERGQDKDYSSQFVFPSPKNSTDTSVRLEDSRGGRWVPG